MPELPDLQAFTKSLSKLFKGRTLEKINVLNNRKLKVSVPKLKKALEHQNLKNVYREGKELRFEFRNGNKLGLHLMLHGELKLFEEKNSHKYTIVEMYFENGKGLAVTDFQGMATPTLNPEESNAPDALSKEVNYRFLKEKLQKSTAIKNLLIDQKVLRGVGNAYADEILWKAGISPFSSANKIPDAKIKSFATAIKSVLKDAEKKILKSHPDIIGGEVRDFMKIHNAKKEESPTGGKILKKMVGGRKTYYTEEQVEYK